MSYLTVQTQVLAILQLMAEFDSGNSVEKDFRILGEGKVHYAILLRGNTGSRGQIDVANLQKIYTRRDNWTVELNLFATYSIDQLDTRARINTLADAVEIHFEKYPSLNKFAGIVRVAIDSYGEPEPWGGASGRLWRQVMNIEVDELSNVLQREDISGGWFRWDGTQKWDGTGRWR